MRSCIWRRKRAIVSAIVLSVAASASAHAELNESGVLTETIVTDIVDANGNPANTIEQVSDEAPFDAAEKLTDPVQPVVLEPQEAPAQLAPSPEPIAPSHYSPSIAASASDAPLAYCTCCNSTCCTKAKKEAATAAMKSAYGGVFYGNNFGYLNDKCYDGPTFFGDNLKGLCDGKLDIGGEARVRYHSENNHRGAGLTGNDDDFWLTRYRMYADYRVNDIFRVYGEYLYADSGGEVFNNRTIEENRGEMQNLFLDTRLTDADTLRLGRQELLLGNQRLVSPLDWANTRRTFQGARLIHAGKDWTVDSFFLNPVNRNAANEDKIDDANEDVQFFGAYASRKANVGTVDAYYLGLNNDIADFDYHTLGSRVAGSNDRFLYEIEGGVQFGSNSPGFGDHSAGFFTGGLGKKLSLCCCGEQWNPTVWFWYDWASGGDDVPGNRGDDGFDHLFPLAHKYLGFMDLFGRRNINDVNFQFITPVLGDKVKLLVWYHHFFLDQATTPYSVGMNPFSAAAAGDRELGQEIDVLFSIALNPRNSALIGYSHFNAGDYYDTTGGVPTNADADFFYFQYQTRF
tara:strand:- start:464492 stop:466204 length:1713 start_codon:yes stop_codon:yes gene_type:complete